MFIEIEFTLMAVDDVDVEQTWALGQVDAEVWGRNCRGELVVTAVSAKRWFFAC